MLKLPWKSEIYSHLLVTFVYFFLVSVLRLVNGGLGMLGLLGILELWLGAMVGTFFLDIDHLVYWLTHSEAEDSREAREIIARGTPLRPDIHRDFAGQVREIRELLESHHAEHTRLIFHSVIGQIIVFVLAVFVLTSGGSIFGSAFIMAVNLHLLKDEWSDFVKNKEHLADWLFWQINEPKIKDFLVEYLLAASFFFLVLTAFLIR